MSGGCEKCGEHTLECLCRPPARKTAGGMITMRQAKSRLRRGHVLHMALEADGRIWWFECPYVLVPDELAQRLAATNYIEGAGDALFPEPGASQSYTAKRKEPA